MCCEYTDSCLGATPVGVLDRYFFGKNCFYASPGKVSFGICSEPVPCPPDGFSGLECGTGSCTDRRIDPLPLCCQQAGGGCRDTVATAAGAIGVFNCETFPPPAEGEIDRRQLGTCGRDGRCVGPR